MGHVDSLGGVALEALRVGYGGRAVVEIDGCFAPASMTAIVGPNGAGKTTLVKSLVGLLRPLGGRVDMSGSTRDAMAYLPQRADIDHSFPINVYDTAAMGLWREIGMWRGLGREQRHRVMRTLDSVGLAADATRPVGALSGGQFQKLLFARLMLQDASLIVLDEPFVGIDARTETDLLAIVDQWHREGRTIVAVLHDLDVVRARFPSTLLLSRRGVQWGSTADILTDVGVHSAYHESDDRFPQAGLVAAQAATASAPGTAA